MALTPDDVVTKQFQHVRFKEGFDPDEVDDFLDEIVVEWRKTIAENDELKAKLAAYESGEPPAAAAAPPRPAPVAGPAPVAEAPQRRRRARRAPPASSSSPSACTTSTSPRASRSATSSSPTPRRRPPRSSPRPRRAVAKRSPSLDRERSGLESRITELRNFERDYRAQLRSYIEGKLRDLETTATTSGSTPVSAIGL